MKINKFKFQVLNYSEGYKAVEILEKNGDSYATLSTNLSSDDQGTDCIFVKDGDFEEEMAQAMAAQGLLVCKEIKGSSGFNSYTLYQITPKLMEISAPD